LSASGEAQGFHVTTIHRHSIRLPSALAVLAIANLHAAAPAVRNLRPPPISTFPPNRWPSRCAPMAGSRVSRWSSMRRRSRAGTPALKGRLGAQAALDTLLQGSAFTAARRQWHPADRPARGRCCPPPAKGEDIVVTGTRIRGKSGGPNPVKTVSARELADLSPKACPRVWPR
jgi:hypothetical protein